MNTAAEIILSRMESHPDFPRAGILFRDLTPVFTDGPSFRAVIAAMVEPFAESFDAIAGLEARGFLLAAAAAHEEGVGVLPIRKSGKLPGQVLSESYQLEYGDATFEVNPRALPPGSRVLVMDDVLATGGTANAAVSLIESAGWVAVGVSVTLELAELDGRQLLGDRSVHSVVRL